MNSVYISQKHTVSNIILHLDNNLERQTETDLDRNIHYGIEILVKWNASINLE